MLHFKRILRFIVQQNIKILYYFTQNTYASILLGYMSYYGVHSKDFNTFRFFCFSFTIYFIIVSFITYLVSRSSACCPFLVKLVGLNFHIKYIGPDNSSEQLISAIIFCFFPLTIELLTDFMGNHRLDSDIARATYTYELDFGKNHSEWNSEIRTEFITRCNSIRDAYVPGGYITRIDKAVRDFYRGRKN